MTVSTKDRTPKLPSDASAWTVGRRVARPEGDDTGVILEAGDQIKVGWDSGRTSYFTPGRVSNVLLEPESVGG